MVLTPDPDLNLRADIKATMQSLDAYVRSGGYRRAASVARELSHKLEQLAAMGDDGPRVRYQEVSPEEAAWAEKRDKQRRRGAQRPVGAPRHPGKCDCAACNAAYGPRKRVEIVELPPRELGPG